MRLTQRLVLYTVLISTVVVLVVGVSVERRVTDRLRTPIGTTEGDPAAMLRGIRQDIGFAGVAALVIGLAAAWLLARSVARPIEELRDVARSLAEGDMSRRPALLGSRRGG